MKKDYSGYMLSDYEKYEILRRGNKDIYYAYFKNYAKFSPEQNTIMLSVNGLHELDEMQELIDEYEEEISVRNNVKNPAMNDEEQQENFDNDNDNIAENKKDFQILSSKYEIETDSHVSETYVGDFLGEEMFPLNNVLSGAQIKISHGEGILDFVYADFLTPTKNTLMLFKFIDAMGETLNLQKRTVQDKPVQEKIYNLLQEIVEDYHKFAYTSSIAHDIFYSSLYSAICPPVFQSERDCSKAINIYYNYLSNLQKEYLELIEFCFDKSYYPNIFSKLYPAQRYFIYRKLKNLPSGSMRKEKFLLTNNSNGEKLPYGMPTTDFVNSLHKIVQGVVPTEEEIDFAEKFGYGPKEFSELLCNPHFISTEYEFSTISEILDLEFTKMLEANINFRKCKRCGKYFIMKGNYDTNYCDRVAEGENRNCQELAAQENYKNKIADNKAIPAYSKYYKRYSARVKVRQIKESDFKKWKYEALTKRDECSDGKISLEEFISWMEGSFPNRKTKI